MEYMRNRLHQQAHAGHSIHFGALDCRRAHLLRSNGNMFSTCFDRCLPRSCFVFCVPFENHVLSDGSMRSCGHLTFFPDIYVCIYIIIHIRHIHIHIHIHIHTYIYYIDIYIYNAFTEAAHNLYQSVSDTRGSMNLWQELYVRPSGAPRRPPLELLFVELHEEAPVARSVSDLGATIRPWDGHGMYRETTWRHRNFEGT